jgi:hypothetical protein
MGVRWAKNLVLVNVLHQQQGIIESGEAGDQRGVPIFDVLFAKQWRGHQYDLLTGVAEERCFG